MPIAGVRYRTIQTAKGPVRLAFAGKKVVEAKNMKAVAVHSPSEFKTDRKKK